MDMIFYFSGTGNSKYVAGRIAEALDDTLLRMNDRIKAKDISPIKTGEHLVIVTPTYAWRIPRLVRDWLLKTPLQGARHAWFVMTCGSEIGSADKYNRMLCQAKGLVCMGTAQIVMPENYIAMFNAPHVDEARQIVAAAQPSIDRAIAAIRAGQPFAPTRNNLYDRFMSGPVNPVFYSCFVRADAFTVSNACISCGQCARRCPANSIVLRDGKPVWSENCTHCMACICYCPAEAIEYGKKSLGKPRYHFEVLQTSPKPIQDTGGHSMHNINALMDHFSINCHSSIRYGGDTVVWFDPFQVKDSPRDGDVIFITHEHYDHFSPEDIRQVMKPDAVLVLPESCLAATQAAGFSPAQLLTVLPGTHETVKGIAFDAVAAYNMGKPFHPQANSWVGYVVELDGCRVYVAGDTDDTPEARAATCDVAFLPVGGTYTMTAPEAASLANVLRPQVAVPTHYGSIVGRMSDGDDFAASQAPDIRCIKLI